MRRPGHIRCVARARLGAALLAAAWTAAPALAQEYAIPEIGVAVDVASDGSVRVTENRTYAYDGAFSWANYRLPKRGFTAIRDIRVREAGEAFVNANSERTGTFLVEHSSEAVNVRWFYSAEDEQRTFTVAYTLDGAVVTGPEWSEFFWRYVAAGREKRTDQLDISIRLPAAVAPESLHAWARGPQGRVDVASVPGGYEARAEQIGARAAVSVRAVFPTAVFDPALVPVTDPEFSLAWAREDETAYRAEQERRAERAVRFAAIGRQLAFGIALLSIAVFTLLYGKYGRRYPADTAMARHGGLVVPGRIEPAAIGWLLARRQTTGGHLIATLLDLARRGYFRITEQLPNTGWLSSGKPTFRIESTAKAPDSGLLPWERSLLEFVRGRLDGGTRDLEKLFRQDSRPVAKWFRAWKREVKAHAYGREWVDERSFEGALWNGGIQIALLLSALAAVGLVGPALVPVAVLCVVMAALSLAIVRRTRAGEQVYGRWKGYRNALSRAGEHGVDDDRLDLHFIYAVAFGVRKSGIAALFESHTDSAAAMTWIVLVNPNSSPAELAHTFTALSATGTAAFGAAAGAAGGASAGAAGGGASGGAG